MKYKYRSAFWCAAAVIGFLQIWAHRLDVNPDGVSYIELAWVGVWHGLSGFVNGYWSPLYPALLSLAFRVVRPGPAWESTVVHLVNFAIYLANLAAFELFLRELLLLRHASPQPEDGRLRLPDHIVWTLGYVFFLWAYQVWLRPMLLTPDLCVAAFAYLALAILLRIRRGRGTWSVYLLLGTVLGLAYLAKAFMFLLAWVFLASALWAAISKKRAAPRVVGATLVFLIVATPEIVALSRAKGRWTFGDSGSLNYCWYVDRIPRRDGLGIPPQAGVPVHPVHQILDRPVVYEFAGPLAVTDPLGFDPSYWYDGVRPYFSLRPQLRAIANTLGYFVQIFSRTGVLFVVFLLLYLLLRNAGRWSGAGPPQWAVWFPLYAAFAIYALVYVEARFVGGFALMLLMGLFAAVQPARQSLEGRASCFIWAIAIVASVATLCYAGADLVAILHPRPSPPFEVARQIEAMGLSFGNSAARNSALSGADPTSPGSREFAAIITRTPGAYWAHLAGVRIVAAVPAGGDYWHADPAAQAAVMEKFAALGVRLVVAEPPQSVLIANPPKGAWTLVPGTGFYLYRLSPSAIAAAIPFSFSLAPSGPSVNSLSAATLRVASADRSSSRDTSR